MPKVRARAAEKDRMPPESEASLLAKVTQAAFLAIQIPGRPAPKARPRMGKHGAYTPKRTRDAETAMRWLLLSQCPKPLTGPLELGVAFYFRAPTSYRKAERERLEENGEYREGKPDIDNLLKLVMDAANGVLWNDDAQVVKIEATKNYGGSEETVINLAGVERALKGQG